MAKKQEIKPRAIVSGIDWSKFLTDVEALLYNRPHLIKDALEKYRNG